ncbi:MAG TPA: LptF/LptG family permease [Candidatus Paceibacterota bacterium]|nr:LptF/LptG family permease [Verrucomicrobiota bacterium]HSA10807.1 LptF/LptG family permease [Candidatus Paceibacterota bacterium]
MRLLDRYLLRELFAPLGYCLCGFLLFWITSDLFVELDGFQKRGLRALDIAEYYLVILPEFLVLVLPIGLLLALLYALTNHARHQEITAIRAAGVSLWRLSLPYLGVGLLASLALFAANEFWVPQSQERTKEILKRRQAPDPNAPGPNEYRNLFFENTRDGHRWRIGVFNSETGEMIEPGVYPTQRDGAKPWELRAERARRVDGLWTFYNVLVLKETADTNAPPVPSLRTNVLVVPEFTETLEEINSEIKIRESMTLRAAKKADVPIKDLVNYLRLHPRPARSDWYWLHTKLEGRLAAPWTCVVVVLIAIPFGVAGGRRNVYVGVASSIVICFIYFVLQQVGLALGTSGRIEPWLAAWFPNLSFALTGLLMTARVR